MSHSPRVVYIVGVQNCGSTLLDALIGSTAGARSLGEAGGFFRFRTAPKCDCGEVGVGCAPCQAVLRSWTEAGEIERMEAVFPLPARGRCLHWTLVPTARRREYATLADRQYRAAAEATGATVLIDSSKNVGRAAAVLLDGTHDVQLVHLVRDPRGHFRSRQSRQRHSRIREAAPVVYLRWLVKNLVISTIMRWRAGRERYLQCRYEDLLADPEHELARIAEFAELDADGLIAAATGPGVRRLHLFEPQRHVDYAVVRLDADRLDRQRLDVRANRRFWWSGGVLASLWGYDRDQTYGSRP